jgi:hypothetical protein
MIDIYNRRRDTVRSAVEHRFGLVGAWRLATLCTNRIRFRINRRPHSHELRVHRIINPQRNGAQPKL